MVYSNLYNWPFLLIILLLVSSLYFKLQWLMVVIIVLWIYYKQYFNMDLFYNYTDVIQMLNNTVYTITACNIEYLYQYFSHHQFHLDSYQKYDLQDFMLMIVVSSKTLQLHFVGSFHSLWISYRENSTFFKLYLIK